MPRTPAERHAYFEKIAARKAAEAKPEVVDQLETYLAMENENRKRIERIEESLGLRDNAQTAVALSEGALTGTVHLLSELAACQHIHTTKDEFLVAQLTLIKKKINEVIDIYE